MHSSANDLEFVCDTKRHLVCIPYSIDNLHRMADALGLKRCWFHGGEKAHYDIPKKRKFEIEAQCRVTDSKEILSIVTGQS